MKKCLMLSGVLLLLAGAFAAAQNGRPTGTLKVETPGLILKLRSPDTPPGSKLKEIPVPPCKDLAMAVGSYEVTSITLCAQDARKDVWSLESNGNLGKLASFEITEGQTTSLEGGQPLTVKTAVSISKGKEVIVRVSYVGTSGEEYGPNVMMGKRPGPRAVVRLRDYDGKVLAQGDYSYGCSTGLG